MDSMHTAISPAMMALINRGAEAYLEELMQLRQDNQHLKEQINELSEMLQEENTNARQVTVATNGAAIGHMHEVVSHATNSASSGN